MGEAKRPGRRRFPRWSAEEDEQLRQICTAEQKVHWCVLEQRFQGRSAKQIRERWLNQLDPRVSRHHWSPREDWRLFLFQRAFGSRWSLFRPHFPRRTDNQLKNRWNSAIRPKLDISNAKLEQLLGNGTVEVGIEGALLARIAGQMHEETSTVLKLCTPNKRDDEAFSSSVLKACVEHRGSTQMKLSFNKQINCRSHSSSPLSAHLEEEDAPKLSFATEALPALRLCPHFL